MHGNLVLAYLVLHFSKTQFLFTCCVHTQVQAMLDMQKLGVHAVDYGNNIRQMAKEKGVANAFDFPGFVPAYIRPQFCTGRGPFRCMFEHGQVRLL